MICPVCGGSSNQYASDKFRPYFECDQCTLVFVPRDAILNPTEELSRYETHNNDEADERYRQYLSQVVAEISPFIKAGETALDFGSGKTDFLSKLLREENLESESYDLYFFPNDGIWTKKFDVIVMCEVIEHLRDPLETMLKLKSMLKPSGRFFIKTKFLPENKDTFKNWYYKNDQTHVEFFNPQSMSKLSECIGMMKPEFLGFDLTMVRAFP